MASIFEQARIDLKTAAESASEEIKIIPKAGDEIALSARVGSRTFKTYDGTAVVYAVVCRFIVEVGDLAGYTPSNGDKIFFKNRAYRMGNPDGGPPWRWHGSDRSSIVILATETAARIE